MLNVEHLAPLLATDVFALLDLLPLAPLGDVTILVLLSPLVPPVEALSFVPLPVFVPSVIELIPAFLEADLILKFVVILISKRASGVPEESFFHVLVVHLKKSLPKLCLDDLVAASWVKLYVSMG